MANCFLCCIAQVLCRRGVRAVAGRVVSCRAFSTAGSSGSDEPFIAVSSQDSGPRTVWPDETMGPFGPQDKRFQLPGNVGFDCHLGGMGDQRLGLKHRVVPDVLSAPSSSDRHEFILAQFINEYQSKEVSLWLQRVSKAEQYFHHSDVECSMHSCPQLLKQELESFFPTLPASAITVVTVVQKPATEAEELDREQLLNKFVSGAKEICFMLWREGYWADFIDPLSGNAFFGAKLSDSILQPEQQQRGHSGFHIEDLASCMVIRHILKDTPTFVGTLITNAPSNSRIMTRLKGQSADSEETD
ncbi:metabolism of cobalamin associated Da isoform X1 [Astyanax mexicanus]|uniref:metabolism of cobalamin associated Da isoform X1 n=1 Tax=Astyanax mexicanus TaxID=7994 RepID=UPI0020CB3884|nr:metabolism of cobalamin associated Da isoform X1 [Astyanax mexicanus]